VNPGVTIHQSPGIIIKFTVMKTFRTIILIAGILVAGIAFNTVAQPQPDAKAKAEVKVKAEQAVAADQNVQVQTIAAAEPEFSHPVMHKGKHKDHHQLKMKEKAHHQKEYKMKEYKMKPMKQKAYKAKHKGKD
jgi:hypothetical protein